MTARLLLGCLMVVAAAGPLGAEGRFKNLHILGEVATRNDELVVTGKAATLLLHEPGWKPHRWTIDLRLAAKGLPLVVHLMPERAGDLAKGGLGRVALGRDKEGLNLGASTFHFDGKAWVRN